MIDDISEPEPQNKKKKKDKDAPMEASVKGFWAYLDVSKFKACPHFIVAWRCRLESASGGVMKLMPLRPVACLSGMIDVDAQSMRLM